MVLHAVLLACAAEFYSANATARIICKYIGNLTVHFYYFCIFVLWMLAKFYDISVSDRNNKY